MKMERAELAQWLRGVLEQRERDRDQHSTARALVLVHDRQTWWELDDDGEPQVNENDERIPVRVRDDSGDVLADSFVELRRAVPGWLTLGAARQHFDRCRYRYGDKAQVYAESVDQGSELAILLDHLPMILEALDGDDAAGRQG